MIRMFAMAAALWSTTALAAPRVVTDIPPVHALVAQVMDGAGTPALLLPPGASPHGYSMRPSEAAALEEAEIVFWIGHGLTPWLERPLEANAGDAHVIELMEVKGVTLLEYREGATFDAHDHDHGAHKDDHAGHDHGAHKDDHAGHDHGAHKDDHAGHGHGDHDHGAHKDDHAGHGHEGHAHGEGAHDPHVWLDPQNAAVWLNAIAEELAEHDPANAALYKANAEKARAGLADLSAEIAAIVAPARGRPFIVFHDAYHYFEHRFGIEAAGAVSISDATNPGAKRLAEVRERLEQSGAACAFAEPQFNPARLEALVEGLPVKIGVLDPLGADLTPGPALYGDLLRKMAGSLAECLAESS